MKLKGSYFFTLRENVKDEDSKSGNLLTRAGYIKKVSAGIYMYLPIGLRTLDKIKRIIKEEMDNAGAQELLMPSLLPEDIYAMCGRVEAFGQDMFHLKDRKNANMVLGPTHEELFAMTAKNMVQSYKDLPFTLYQQADKFRDEPRPRYGLIRVREFIMKDAYSFDADDNSQEESYKKMFDAYHRIFKRMGLDYTVVKASTGAMGGTLSEEFQAITDIGEDVLVLCDKCNYATNIEVGEFKYIDDKEAEKKLELVETPNASTIEEVAKYLKVDTKKTVKALLMNVESKLTIFFIRGDRDLNINKACKLLNVKEINFADDNLIAKSNAVPGFTGPIELTGAKIVIDEEILHMKNFIVGGNKEGYHYVNANINDFKYDIKGDISNVLEKDVCPMCGGKIYFKHGIEVGNTFKLGTHYSEDLGLTYLDKNGKKQVVTMGSYGIGPGRILAAIVEQRSDDNGLVLPMSLAPYQVSIVVVDTNDEEVRNYANKLYDELNSNNIEVLLDDRDERAGVKFKDMDLIGIPIRITIGKKFGDGFIEFKLRCEDNSSDIALDKVIDTIKEYVNKDI